MKKTLIRLLVLVFILSAMMCFSTGCAHEHAFDKQVASNDYISKEATCLDVAEYFYSCSCGAKGEETFTYGEPLGHDFGAWTSNQDDTHTRVCSRDATHTETGGCSGGTKSCAQKAVCETCNTEYGSTDPHVFEERVVSDDYKYRSANCLTPAKYYFSCVCGEKGEQTFENGEPLGHSWRPWGKAYLASNSHSRTCYRCTDGYETEKCYGGNATCTEKATCDVCKTSYGEPLSHDWGAWTSNGDDTHSRVCANDSKHVETEGCYGGEDPCVTKSICEGCNTEYGEIEGHQWKDWVSIGGGQHKRVCSSNSAHTETGYCEGGNKTCTERAICDVCKNPYGSVLEHKWGAWTSNGDDTHSRVCENDSSHVETVDCFGGEAPCETKSICEDCNAEYGEIKGHNWQRWWSNKDGTHTRYCSSNSSHTETEECSGGNKTCYAQAICEKCSVAYGGTNEHDYGEYEHYKNATCNDYAKQRATCQNKNCYAYLERNDETQPPRGYHVYNVYDNCVDCGEKKETSKGLVYTKYYSDSFYTLTSLGDCTDTEIVIAQYVDGYFVREITDEYGSGIFDYGGDWSYSYRQALAKITKVTIPQTVNYIGEYAFRKMPALETIIIEGSDVVIDNYAFYFCPKLKQVTIAGDNVQIGNYAFSQCAKLETFEIGGYISKIGASAFSGCKLLKDIELKQGLTELGNYAFMESALESVTIPATAKTIGSGAFSTCKQLRSATFEGKTNSFGTSMFSGCATLTNVKFPTNLTSIPNSTFDNCSMLATITIPSGVTSIGDSAFNGTGLVSVTIPSGVTSIGRLAFNNCYKLYEIINKSSLTISVGDTTNGYIGYYAKSIHNGNSKIINQNDFLFITDSGVNYLIGYAGVVSEITLPDNFNGKEYALYEYLFNGAKAYTKITLSDGVCAIGKDAFKDCDKSIFTIKDGAKYVGTATNPYYAVIGPDNSPTSCIIDSNTKIFADKSFYNCGSLTSINVPSGIKHFGLSALDSCASLTYNVKNNIKYLGDETNPYLVAMGVTDSSLTSYAVEEGTRFINYGAFWNCSKATSISIPSSVIYIEQSAFNFCEKLESMVIPNGVTKIGETMFSNCKALTSVEIPDSVISIGYRAFYNCRNLKTIKLPSGLVSIGNEAFAQSGVENIEIPDGVTSLGKFTFSYASSLKSIVISKNLTYIGERCFNGCGYFKTVYYKGTAEDWANIVVLDDLNNYLARTTKYFYIENEEDLPNDSGKYWHYVDGVPTAW